MMKLRGLMTDRLVQQAQDVFLPVWEQTNGNDGYVSFELDPLLEDKQLGPEPRYACQAVYRAWQAVVEGS